MGCVATSSATHSPHRHLRTRHAELACERRTARGRGHQCAEGPGQPASGQEPWSDARRPPGA
eukprot:10870204-Alexandrium_andersonii.AAC.1